MAIIQSHLLHEGGQGDGVERVGDYYSIFFQNVPMCVCVCVCVGGGGVGFLMELPGKNTPTVSLVMEGNQT